MDPQTQEDYCREGRSRDHARVSRRREIRRLLPVDAQVELLRREAHHRHVDIRDELRAYYRWDDPDIRAKKLERIREKVEQPLVAA